MKRTIRHILALSGGKDSTALAIYLRDRVPEMEYVFCDTHKELPETQYTWNQRESLAELERPERIAEIKQRNEKAIQGERRRQPNRPLIDVLQDIYDDESDEQPCFFCDS